MVSKLSSADFDRRHTSRIQPESMMPSSSKSSNSLRRREILSSYRVDGVASEVSAGRHAPSLGARDYERLPEILAGICYLAFIVRMLKNLVEVFTNDDRSRISADSCHCPLSSHPW